MKNIEPSLNSQLLDESFSNITAIPKFRPDSPEPIPVHISQSQNIAEANNLATTKDLEKKLADAEKALAIALAIEKTKESLGSQTIGVQATPPVTSRLEDEPKETNWLLIGGISVGTLAVLGAIVYFGFIKK